MSAPFLNPNDLPVEGVSDHFSIYVIWRGKKKCLLSLICWPKRRKTCQINHFSDKHVLFPAEGALWHDSLSLKFQVELYCLIFSSVLFIVFFSGILMNSLIFASRWKESGNLVSMNATRKITQAMAFWMKLECTCLKEYHNIWKKKKSVWKGDGPAI